MPRFHALSTYLKSRFGTRVRKIPLDAGFTCPNRDGSLSREGCSFCNEKGSGTGLYTQGLDLQEQWRRYHLQMSARQPGTLFLGYLQSYSNTYGPPEKLAHALDELVGLPDFVGLCIGTRPDCLDEEKLDILAAAPMQELWLDLGLQSANDQTLARINRGHDAAAFAHAVQLAAQRGIKVCAHIIAGLPGETTQDFLASVRFAAALPIGGIKLHNLYLVKGTPLARDWKREVFSLMNREEYLEALVSALTGLRPEVVIHRLASDPDEEELLAPLWALSKSAFLTDLDNTLRSRDLWQGRDLDPDGVKPPWFTP